MRTDLAWRIAGFVERTGLADLTAARQARIALCCLDFLGLAAAASDMEEAREATRLAERGPVDLPGIGAGLGERSAIVALGYAGALLQMHDGFGRGGNHPSSALVPVAWVLGRDRPLTETLGALAVGYEVANRLSEATHPAQSVRGSAPTATMGAIGAAAIAAKLTGLDRAGIAQSLSIAAILAPLAPYEALRVHGSAVPFHGGCAGRAGVEAAILAAGGLEGGASVLEGRPGMAGALEFLKGAPAQVAAPEEWEGQTLDSVYFKSTPGCRHVQPALEALARIQPDPAESGRIADVLVETYPLALAFAAAPDARYALYDRLMSLPWAIAASLLNGGMSVGVARARPDAAALDRMIARIRVAEATDLAALYPGRLEARVTIRFDDGSKTRGEAGLLYGEAPLAETLTPAGGAVAPMSRAALIARATEFLAPVWKGAETAFVRDVRRLAPGDGVEPSER